MGKRLENSSRWCKFVHKLVYMEPQLLMAILLLAFLILQILFIIICIKIVARIFARAFLKEYFKLEKKRISDEHNALTKKLSK